MHAKILAQFRERITMTARQSLRHAKSGPNMEDEAPVIYGLELQVLSNLRCSIFTYSCLKVMSNENIDKKMFE